MTTTIKMSNIEAAQILKEWTHEAENDDNAQAVAAFKMGAAALVTNAELAIAVTNLRAVVDRLVADGARLGPDDKGCMLYAREVLDKAAR